MFRSESVAHDEYSSSPSSFSAQSSSMRWVMVLVVVLVLIAGVFVYKYFSDKADSKLPDKQQQQQQQQQPQQQQQQQHSSQPRPFMATKQKSERPNDIESQTRVTNGDADPNRQTVDDPLLQPTNQRSPNSESLKNEREQERLRLRHRLVVPPLPQRSERPRNTFLFEPNPIQGLLVGMDPSKIIDQVSARGKLPRVRNIDREQSLFADYKMLVEDGDPNVKIIKGWDLTESKLIDTCLVMLRLLSFSESQRLEFISTKNQDHYNRHIRFLNIAEDWLCRFMVRAFAPEKGTKFEDLEFPTFAEPKKAPWGKNWYGFSIRYTQVAAHYLLITEILPQETVLECLPAQDKISRKKMREMVARSILSFIGAPGVAFGVRRTKSQRVMLFGPYCVAQDVLGKSVEFVASSAFSEGIRDMIVELQTKPGAEGLHRDLSYFDRSHVSFKHLEIQADAANAYVYALITPLYSHALTPMNVWTRMSEILLHRKVGYGLVGVFGRHSNLRCLTNDAATENELFVAPFSRFVLFKTKQTAFSVRFQHETIPFFDADQTDVEQTKMAPYWVQYRRVHEMGKAYLPTFPDSGFILYPADVESVTVAKTGKDYYPKSATSFVFRVGQHAFAYQKYEIKEICRKAVITEFLHIDASVIGAETITIHTTIDNRNENSMKYVPVVDQEHVIVPAATSVSVRVDVRYTEERVSYAYAKTEPFDYRLETRIVTANGTEFPVKFEILSDAAVCYARNRPQILCPMQWTEEPDRLVKTIADRDYTFIFDNIALQYVVADPEIHA